MLSHYGIKKHNLSLISQVVVNYFPPYFATISTEIKADKVRRDNSINSFNDVPETHCET